jgi:uncharacterized protein YydD (DUF2326 family)
MLVEIASDVFRTNTIRFEVGLNVVLGDENATNSIGKSTLLMIVDFVFGGNALLSHNLDLVPELGHHDYRFTFSFREELYRFRRGTHEPSMVYLCDEHFEPERALPLEEYTALLKQSYGITLPDLSFRSLAGLYFRVWGKDNLHVERPLHVTPSQAAKDSVNTLIKTYNRYDSIRSLAEQLATLEAETKAVQAAQRYAILPTVGVRDYNASKKRIAELENELDDIKANLARYATNLSAVVNKEVLALKGEKDDLLALRFTIQSRLQRTRRNLQESRHITSKNFADLLKFFPEINRTRLEAIEEFHNGVARALGEELKEAQRELEQRLQQIDEAISAIDRQMTDTLSSIDEPTVLVDRVVHVASNLQEARETADRYESDRDNAQRVKTLKVQLSSEKSKVVEDVQAAVNIGIEQIVTSVFGSDRKSPRLTLRENSYSYEVYDDTGTGTAYASLILLCHIAERR